MSSAFQNILCAISLLFRGSDFAEDYIFILPFCVLVAHLKMIIWCKEITLKWCGVVISWHFYEESVVFALWAAKYSIWISNNLHVNFYSLAERVILLLVCVASISGFQWLWLCKNCGQMKKLGQGWGEEQRKSRDLYASISLAPSPPPFILFRVWLALMPQLVFPGNLDVSMCSTKIFELWIWAQLYYHCVKNPCDKLQMWFH